MIKKAVCEICKDAEHKYRCPQCKIVYCSLECYKQHKDLCQSKPRTENVTASPTSIQSQLSDIPEFELTEDDTEDRVGLDQLKALGSDKSLKEMLANPHLRQMLVALVQSESPDQKLGLAMQEPIFTEFADKCLHLVETESRNGGS